MNSMVFSPDALDRLPPDDRGLFSSYGLGERLEPPFACVHHAFEFFALGHPDLIAVEDFQRKATYAELDRQANCLAARLRTTGVTSRARVCLLAERSIIMVVGILGVLKAGAAYVPLDGNVVSDSTLRHALNDSGAFLVLAQRKFTERVSGVLTISLEDSICDEPSASHCLKPEDLSTTSDSAYIIYTSGTTGVPKGVEVMHSNVTNLVCLAPGNLGMRPGIRVSQLMNISFDMAAWEILGSLCNGSTLCLRGKTSKEWRAVMRTVDVVIATPSMLAPHEPSDYPTIKVVAVAGEPCPKALADSWSNAVDFYNCCGPTEVTIVNTMHLHRPDKSFGIGGPTPNNTVYILDEERKPAKIGDVGVMWAGGSGVTRGYLNLPEKTAEKYKVDPFLNDGSLMFNTGDLGRWNRDGSLEHLGRVDHQVKIKGFRVELDGVASAMEHCPGVKVAAAILMDGELWGFFSPSTVLTEDVKSATARVQPYYATPTHFVPLDGFPETTNGKLDKRALECLARDYATGPAATITPLVSMAQSQLSSDHPTQIQAPNHSHLSASSMGSSRSSINTGSNDSTVAALPLDEKEKIDSSSLEDQTQMWSDYQQDILPEKRQGRLMRNLRHQIFYLYRRLFGVAFLTNLGIFIIVVVEGANAAQIGEIVIANLFVAVLMRQDYVVDAFFTVFTAVPSSWPMAIRSVCARVYHIGGLHSGCAVSGVLWLVLFTVQATIEMVQHKKTSTATVGVTYAILTLLIGILTLAYPSVRARYHDSFEVSHRYMGWTATALVWAQTVLLTNDYRTAGQTLGQALISSAPFWLLLVMTGSLILPWLRLRKVPVRAEVLSPHAVRLYFDYVTPKTGSFVRLSTSPWTEWHGFATVPEPGMKGFSLIVSKAGDWTADQIAHPPTHLWVRGIPTFGVMRIVPLFRRIIVVATGSGIGPCTAAILEQRIPMRLLWTAPNVRETFGDKLVDSILTAAPDAVIYNTRQRGKPDMVKLTYRMVKEFDAEAVCIISNRKLTEKVVYGMGPFRIQYSPMLLPEHVRLEPHPTARSRAVATTRFSEGSTIAIIPSLVNVLLPPEKSRSQCQSVQWNDHHRRLCKIYHQFSSSTAFQSLAPHAKLDALLLAHLLAHTSVSSQASLQNNSSPISVFRSLLPGPNSGDFNLPIPNLKPAVSRQTAESLHSRFHNNNFAVHSHLTTIGHGIFPLASRLFNHSCYPNAAAKYIFTLAGAVNMEVVALRDIFPNEEICVPYLDPALIQSRQQIFNFTYGFRCTCPSCQEMQHLGDIPAPPTEPEELSSIAKTLRNFVGLDPPLKVLPSKPKEAVPHLLLCVFHETYLSNLSETFSKSSHEGQYDLALDAGVTLLGAYIMIYPPNYPQIGMHLLELAKTAWNMLISTGETGSDTTHAMTERVRDFLNLGRKVLMVYGAEGDEGGPLQEVETLQSLLNAES
ncbi:putative adenylate-forming reductase, a natural product biosynthesis enzyme that resembles non-ribosomal peptide synthetases, yet serves to modify one substrate, rather than to condense two or more building blocks [Lyophyllum shimeji]|uniref:SET domain-containing protein n=1 Tax=Lyophyllum shimeji TaxID=47721 RepID=A0A9P3UMG1_LYOSH|nr:putative adenylate-forming reductase, a natural product biosynthesis enzyme that resembles non-ribosomal peptide synthetases, yet serves to modify one substrate, rather than to condense two or more building blocks [Lyophyllum shimeji]